MSNIAFDFLTESFLFDERYIENNFKNVSKKDLTLELQKYREYIQGKHADIIEETQNASELNITIESSGNLPNDQLLKQLALYMDKVVISDPIFELTSPKSNLHTAMSKLMNINANSEVDRIQLAHNAKYMKHTTPLVATQFVKYVPISLIHEAPKELPILYSRDNFSSELSKELYSFFYKNAKVYNVIQKNGTMYYDKNDKLRLGTTIAIDFDSEHIRSHIYQFLQQEVKSFDENTGKIQIMQYIPDSITPNDFNAWVKNSINRAAIAEFRTTLNEAILAKKLNCMYMAKSQFTSDLLSQTVAANSVDTDLANLSMNLDLPVLDKISLDDLMYIRFNNGEAFHNFRTQLNSKLLSLRGITDKDDLQRKLESISYELNQTQVYEVKKEYRKITKTFAADASLLTGSLITSFSTGGLTLIGAAGAIIKGSFDYFKYLNQVKENNGYFLWKLKHQGNFK